MVWLEVKGCFSACWLAKLTWSRGWKPRVAIFSAKGRFEELVDGWRDVAAAWDCERAIWRAEIVLPTRGHESERRGCGWVR